ncbi:hypothetical protein K402DRAFT_400397 [Aulographum hederae CBS 113979]|uniref:Uncharacterized protein n=1 Tax=Aulographum hederae CBS 113979 TaxID=1176131 RepID=A0A6G1HEM8_9PEZI|nr:hypothetical protein K402DRAFT_400397 [Aulographum hederae CBS 113979]
MKLVPLFAAAAAASVIRRDNSTLPGANPGPRMESMEKIDGAERVSIPHGPYKLEAGGMFSKMIYDAKKPCSDCYITGMQATIKYANGTEANVDTGAWLHHIDVFGAQGILWASGNERPHLRLNTKYKYGIDMPPTGFFAVNVDLMSNAKDDKDLTLFIDYEFIPKSKAVGYKPSLMSWNDVGQPMGKEGKYSFSSMPLTSPVDGQLLYAIGHMHDGGTDVKLFINDVEVCKSIMTYNSRPGYNVTASAHDDMEGMEGMEGMDGMDMEEEGEAGHSHGGKLAKRDGEGEWHISDPGWCENFGEIKKGDKMRIEAAYDADKYGLMTHNGEAERLMGIMRVYIGPK